MMRKERRRSKIHSMEMPRGVVAEGWGKGWVLFSFLIILQSFWNVVNFYS